MDLLEPQDLILADRGFSIVEDLAKISVTLTIPPPSSGLDQQERSGVLKTASVANARIHVHIIRFGPRLSQQIFYFLDSMLS